MSAYYFIWMKKAHIYLSNIYFDFRRQFICMVYDIDGYSKFLKY